jgi:predicted permease
MRWTRFFRRRQLDKECEQELEAHLQIETDENIARGMTPQEAHYAAQRKFGNTTLIREEIYYMNSLGWLDSLWQDLRFALRMLRKNPGFTIVAILTLALGIGGNTAMFSVVYGVLLRPLPYPAPERIVQIARTYRGQEDFSDFTANAFDFWQEHRDPFQFIAASTGVGFNLVGAGEPERINALRVSANYFDVYGVGPFMGRRFAGDEDRVGGPQVAVLSYGLWKAHFNGDAGAVGRSVALDGVPYTVIGVMPAGFASIPPADLWTTIGPVRQSVGRGQNYRVLARLKQGDSAKQASSYLAALTQPFANQNYQFMREQDRKLLSFWAAPFRYAVSSDDRKPVLILFSAIAFVLLIACVNVANLLLARTAERSREIALRTALGAGRGRIVRQVLTESVLLATFGAALGLVLAFCGLHALIAIAPPDALARAPHIELNRWALLFTGGVAVLTGILFGLAPALQAAGVNLNEAIKASESHASFGPRRHRLSAAMVCAEVALSLILLIGSGLLIRTFIGLLDKDPGFNPQNLLSVQVWTTGSKYTSTSALSGFYDELVRRIEAIPGVQSAAVVGAGLPLDSGVNLNPGVWVDGHQRFPSVDYREITPDYFHTLGVPLLMGRFFQLADSPQAAKVAIINAAFARQYFPHQNPVGRSLTLEHVELHIVGVTGDVRSSLKEAAPPTFFVPIAQAPYEIDQLIQNWAPTSILVRTAVNPLGLARDVEATVRNTDASIPMGHTRSMEEVLAISLEFHRLLMDLMGVFAGFALALVSVGIYGVLAYSVRQRTHEIGIRLAMGARSKDVLKMVVGQGFKFALIGLGIGLAVAPAVTRYLSSQLYGVKPNDALTFGAVSLLLLAVSLLAAYIPARQATKVDPMVALRYE